MAMVNVLLQDSRLQEQGRNAAYFSLECCVRKSYGYKTDISLVDVITRFTRDGSTFPLHFEHRVNAINDLKYARFTTRLSP